MCNRNNLSLQIDKIGCQNLRALFNKCGAVIDPQSKQGSRKTSIMYLNNVIVMRLGGLGGLTIENIRAISKLFRWEIIGLGFCWAWIVANMLYARNAEFSVSGKYVLVLYGTLALSAGIVAFLRPRISSVILNEKNHITTLVLIAFGLIGSACVAIGSITSKPAYFIFGLTLIGICGGSFEVKWGVIVSRLSLRGVYCNVLAAMLVSSVCGLVVRGLPDEGFFIASIALLCATGSFFLIAVQQQKKSLCITDNSPKKTQFPEITSQENKTLYWIILACFIYALIHLGAITISYTHIPVKDVYLTRSVANFTACIALVLILILYKPVRTVTLFKAVLPITAVGLLCKLIYPTEYGVIALAVLCVGNKLFEILSWILIIEFIRDFRFPVGKALGLLVAAKNAGFLFGALLTYYALHLTEQGIIVIQSFISLILVLLIICFFWLLFSERVFARLFNKTVARNTTEMTFKPAERKAKAFAEEKGLTPRETEVFFLLARGKSQS